MTINVTHITKDTKISDLLNEMAIFLLDRFYFTPFKNRRILKN